MIAIRAAKVAMVAAIALFATLVAFGNLTDYGTNFAFVQHVLSMDTIFPGSTIGYRAITAPALHHAAYMLIIAAEAATAVLCWVGAGALLRRLRADAATFHDLCGVRAHARLPALAGRLHDDWRRMVRHVAIAAVERRAERLPVRDGDPGGADFRRDAGWRDGVEAQQGVIVGTPWPRFSAAAMASFTPHGHRQKL
jgi:hypothetical protein